MRSSIVVTGFGMCASTGESIQPAINNLLDLEFSPGNSIPVPLPPDLGSGESVQVFCVPGPDPKILSGLRGPIPDRVTLMAMIAVERALESAQVDLRRTELARIGLIGNTCFGVGQTVDGYLRTLLVKGPSRVSPITFSRSVPNSIIGEISRRHSIQGPSTLLMGSSAIGYGMDLVAQNEADLVVCVGVDEIRDILVWTYKRAGLLDDGLVLGEAAAAIVLEKEEHAVIRGAPVLCKVTGQAMTFCAEATHRVNLFTKDSIQWAIEESLRQCNSESQSVHAVIALDSGDVQLASNESQAIASSLGAVLKIAPKRVFGETFGSSEVLAVGIGATLLKSGQSGFDGGLCLVNSYQVGGSVWSTVLR